MTEAQDNQSLPVQSAVRVERHFPRFTLAQRWEHALLFLSFTVLALTGLPQKYFDLWGHLILTSPSRLILVRQIHHAAAVVLIIEVIYHIGHSLYLMLRGRLSADIFPTWKDFRDAWQMLRYLFFLTERKPEFGKYNFEQKFTYWFLFVGIGILVLTGIILWFPIQWTRVFPGETIPAAYRAHSSEALVALIFIVVWHFYHVHVERLNLSIFSGRLSEREVQDYHTLEYRRLVEEEARANFGEPDAPESGEIAG